MGDTAFNKIDKNPYTHGTHIPDGERDNKINEIHSMIEGENVMEKNKQEIKGIPKE